MNQPPPRATTKVTFIDLEFGAIPNRGAPLGDIASSLVSLHDLLRDLGTFAAYPSRVEFREIQVVGIEMGNPLTIKLSLWAISAEAVKAFQEICRDIILLRERRPHREALSAGRRADIDAKRRANINTALDRLLHADGRSDHLTDKEVQRLYGHILALENAEIPLRRVVVRAQ